MIIIPIVSIKLRNHGYKNKDKDFKVKRITRTNQFKVAKQKLTCYYYRAFERLFKICKLISC